MRNEGNPFFRHFALVIGNDRFLEVPMRRHDYNKEAVLRDQVREQPAKAEVHGELGAWLFRAGRLTQAREALQGGLAQARQTAGLHHLLGLIFAGAEDWPSAERHLARAVTQQPMCFEFARDLGLVQGAAGRLAASVETLRSALSLGGADAAGAALRSLVRVGEKALAEAGVKPERRPPQPDRRAAAIERLVTRDPGMAEVIAFRRTDPTAEDRENLKAARRALARLAAQHPAYPDLHFGMSLVAEQLGEIDRAIEAAEKALAINPRYVEACLLAVRLYERSGKKDQAAERCRQASELRPQWIDTHLRLGRLMREQGRPADAADAYRRALTLNHRCDEAKRGLETLQTAAAEGGKL
jgi:tetratricopeptide (TPR) repeat protein